MTIYQLTDDETMIGAKTWLSQFGATDENYMAAHWARFVATRDFVLSNVPESSQLTIVDVGAHWLHNAFLYANRGHRLICVDAPDLMETSLIRRTADAMGAEVKATRRMEMAEGLTDIPESSIDVLLFCEIIEHLAFNPIPFWTEVYRILKPGGRIIVTTPNAFYFRTVSERLRRIMGGECFGLSLSEIFETGTYGHHWKEFSLPELQAYFKQLSSDFDTDRYQMVYHSGEKNIDITGAIEINIEKKLDIRAFNIYLDVILKNKNVGILIKPPWIPV